LNYGEKLSFSSRALTVDYNGATLAVNLSLFEACDRTIETHILHIYGKVSNDVHPSIILYIAYVVRFRAFVDILLLI